MRKVKREFICKFCGKCFSPEYTTVQGYGYSRPEISCCSKACATSLERSRSPVELKSQALEYIKSKGQYCTAAEVRTGINVSSKTLTKQGIKIAALNSQLGFDKSKSKFESTVGEVLRDSFATVEREKTFDGLVGVTGHPLRVDFFIPEINTVIEADGSQHHSNAHPWSVHKNGTVSQYDQIKNDYFKRNAIRLIRVPYKRDIKKSDVLSQLDSIT